MFTLLRNADLHAPAHRGVVDVLAVGGRIAWFGSDASPLGTGLTVDEVDLDGAVVVPGLVDGHVHVTGGGGEGGPTTATPQPALSTYTTAGVTCVVGLLGTDDVVRTPAQVLQRVRALRELGLRAWMLTGGYGLPPVTVTGDLSIDLVHLEPVLGVGEVAISDHRGTAPSADGLVTLAARVRTAALLAGKAGSVHVHVGDGAGGLDPLRAAIAASDVPVRHWHPTHVNRAPGLLDDAIDLSRSSGVRIDVTAFTVEGPDDPTTAAAPALEQALARGVPLDRLTCSSDAGGSQPVFGADGELLRLDTADCDGLLSAVRALVASGMPLSDALRPVTSTPADQLGLDGPGRVDLHGPDHLVVLDDALAVRSVHAGGTWHVRDGRPVADREAAGTRRDPRA